MALKMDIPSNTRNDPIIMHPFEEVGVYGFAHVGQSVDKPCPINN